MSANKIAFLSQQIRQLRKADSKLRVFGAPSHRYRFQSTLSESQLADFECAQNCQLPADYRAFLQLIGNGGGGPYYGIVSLQDAALESDLSQPGISRPCRTTSQSRRSIRATIDGIMLDWWQDDAAHLQLVQKIRNAISAKTR